MTLKAALLESLIDPDEWLTSECPEELIDKALEVSEAGVQTGIGFEADLGWFMICYDPSNNVKKKEG